MHNLLNVAKIASTGVTMSQMLKSVEANADFAGIGLNSCINRAYVDTKSQFIEKAINVRLNEDSVAQINGTKNYDLKM